MLVLIARNFSRSVGVRIGLLFLLTAGLVSLLVGKQFLNRQQTSVAEAAVYQREDIQRNRHYHPNELGLLLYYVPFTLVNETLPINGLSIGQRDLNPSIQRVTIRALEAQQYDTDLINPANLLAGNIDFSFVLIYLFPLLIIAFTYNIVSDERERGTWRLVVVQTGHPLRLIRQQFLVRGLVLGGLAVGLLLLAVPVLGIAPDHHYGLFVFTSVLYLLGWFGLCFWVVSLYKSSAFNAMLLVTIWINLLLIVPAAVNRFIVNRYPVPEALATTVKQRQGYHEKWDMDKTETMTRFFAHYPQFSTYRWSDTEFSWFWYYAMQQMGDDESASQSREFRQKLRQREVTSRRIAWFIPSLHAQLQLNEITRSGLGNQLRFLDQTGRFHEKMRLHFYPKIFRDMPVSAERWDAIAVETFTDDSAINLLELSVPLLVFGLLFVGLGWLNFRRNRYVP